MRHRLCSADILTLFFSHTLNLEHVLFMTTLKASFDPASVYGYHAHIYYQSPAQREQAAYIRSALDELFEVELGRWRDEPVGPHPQPMYQVAFAPELLPVLIPWLQSVRGELSILVHLRSGAGDLIDHTDGAFWLGSALPLNLDFFQQGHSRA